MKFFKNEKAVIRLSLAAGIIFLLIHFVLSLLFYKERMAHGDNSFYAVKLIQYQVMICENHRFSVFLFQWIPWLALKAGAGIAQLLKIYSASFQFYFIVLFVVTAFVFKNMKGAFAMLFFLMLSFRRDFFIPVTEYQPAYLTSFALCSIFFSGVFSSRPKALIFSLVIIFISLNFHYVSLLAIAYIFVFDSLLFSATETSIPYLDFDPLYKTTEFLSAKDVAITSHLSLAAVPL